MGLINFACKKEHTKVRKSHRQKCENRIAKNAKIASPKSAKIASPKMQKSHRQKVQKSHHQKWGNRIALILEYTQYSCSK